MSQLRFNIFRKNIQSGRRDNQVLLPSPESQISLGVQFPEVAGSQPFRCIRSAQSTIFPISCRDISAAHQNFSVFRQLEFPPRQNLSNAALRRPKRVIQTDQRRRLRHAVALHDGIPKSLEKQFRLARKRRASTNKRPESPAEHSVNAPKNPRAFQKRPAFTTLYGRVKPRPPSARIHLAFDSS